MRYYFHGDYSEDDASRIFDARLDAFVNRDEWDDRHPVWWDVQRLHWEMKRMSQARLGRSGYQRPKNAKNALPVIQIPRGHKAHGFWEQRIEPLPPQGLGKPMDNVP